MTLIADVTAALTVPVVEGDPASNTSPAKAHSQKVYDLLVPVFGVDKVHANAAEEKADFPDCVYKIGGSTNIQNFNIVTAGVSVFLIIMRDNRYEDLTEKFDAFAVVVDSTAGVEITDTASDWASERNIHEIALELVITTPTIDFNGNDGGVIYIKGACRSTYNEMDNCLKQDKTCQHHFIIQANNQAKLDQIRTELDAVMLGYSECLKCDLMNHAEDTPLESPGGLVSWAITYQNTRIIHD